MLKHKLQLPHEYSWLNIIFVPVSRPASRHVTGGIITREVILLRIPRLSLYYRNEGMQRGLASTTLERPAGASEEHSTALRNPSAVYERS